MSYLSDTLTVGVLLVLLFGAISLYLYTRIQQSEQKIHLLESILLDLKMSTEIKTYTELPADEETPEGPTDQGRTQEQPQERNEEPEQTYVSLDDSAESITEYTSLDDVEEKGHTAITLEDSEHHESEHAPSTPAATAVLYDNMTLKDLQSLARTRGITGAGSMKKVAIIEALKTSDRSTVIKPGSVGANSFLETSALVSDGSA